MCVHALHAGSVMSPVTGSGRCDWETDLPVHHLYCKDTKEKRKDELTLSSSKVINQYFNILVHNMCFARLKAFTFGLKPFMALHAG